MSEAVVPGMAALAVAAFLAGAVNAVAGGGTLLTFPVLAAILPPDPARLVVANATSTIGLWPASVAASWAYRSERSGQPPWSLWLLLPSVCGAVVGAAAVVVCPPEWFAGCVPWLILVAAAAFAFQPSFARFAGATGPVAAGAASKAGAPSVTASGHPGGPRLAAACVLQFLVAVYGGYFGAGIGILMLAVLGLLGLGDIHRVNAVKNSLAMAINGVAAGLFAVGSASGTHGVSWLHAAVMTAAAVLGSLAASGVARRLPAPLVRRGVAILGFGLAAYYFWRQ